MQFPLSFVQALAIFIGAAQARQCTGGGNGGIGFSKGMQPFLRNNPLPNGFPWGDTKGDSLTPPKTGVTRYYDFTISRGVKSPDGYQKPMILFNDQFPGPLIEANWGDEIQVTIHNNITGPEEGTSVHWHGILQNGTPWMDGIPSITQCPIAPGTTLVYKWLADSYGTSWYHSHYAGQLLDGMMGPMVIHGPDHVAYDLDLGPVVIGDYFHTPYVTLVDNILSTNATLRVQPTDNTLINGKMPYNCSLAAPGSKCDSSRSKMASYRVQAGKTYKMRIINAGAGSLLGFSIDNHNVTIISNDFVPLKPYSTDFVQLGAGQRSDILFTPKNNGSVFMRAQSLGKFCSRSFSAPARGVIHIGRDSSVPKTEPHTPPVDEGLCPNDPLNMTEPYYPQEPPIPSITYNITINEFDNSTGQHQFYMNGVAFRGDFSNPILPLVHAGNLTSFKPEWNVVDFGTNTSVRINVWNNNTSPHPMHLHGHNMWVLASGPGQWDGQTIVNPHNPQRRDVHNLSPFGYMVLQYNTDNPGAWAFHCHIAFHLSQGLYMTFVERPEDVRAMKMPEVPGEVCARWDEWAETHVVEQPDSGV